MSHLDVGESQPISRLDGTRLMDSNFEADTGDLVIVEMAGTFAVIDAATGEYLALGAHGFYTFGADVPRDTCFIPCWSKDPVERTHMEGDCRP